jgi:hypothetical protein
LIIAFSLLSKVVLANFSAQGRAFLVRYADDFVMGFACERDARRVLEVLPKRFGKYGLTIHPDKTRLLPFERPGKRSSTLGSGQAPPGTF